MSRGNALYKSYRIAPQEDLDANCNGEEEDLDDDSDKDEDFEPPEEVNHSDTEILGEGEKMLEELRNLGEDTTSCTCCTSCSRSCSYLCYFG